jgi:DNA helicase IV
MSTDELTTEQEYVDHAYRSLVDMRARTQRVFDRIMDTSGFQELDHEIALRRRIAALGDSPRPLLFGRIDEDDGDRWYIGRRHVESEAGDEVVIEWRTPVAEPFYRAGAGDPMGLVRRRQLMVENHQLVSFADDVFDDDAVEPGELRRRAHPPDPAPLDRARAPVAGGAERPGELSAHQRERQWE